MKQPKAEFRTLQRKQLDAKLERAGLRAVEQPRMGWIRAIRAALGMSALQLGKRLGMSPQGVLELEKREVAQTVTLATLRRVADALDAELVVALLPKTSLEVMVRDQARRKAIKERNRVVHTMRLEEQETGVDEALDVDTSVESWLTTRISRLWD